MFPRAALDEDKEMVVQKIVNDLATVFVISEFIL